MGGPIGPKLGGRVRGASPCVFHRVGVVGGAVCHAHKAKIAEIRILGAVWGRLVVALGTSGTKLGRGVAPARPRPLCLHGHAHFWGKTCLGLCKGTIGWFRVKQGY